MFKYKKKGFNPKRESLDLFSPSSPEIVLNIDDENRRLAARIAVDHDKTCITAKSPEGLRWGPYLDVFYGLVNV